MIATALFLSATFPATLTLDTNDPLAPLVVPQLAVSCIFAFVSVLQIVYCSIAIIKMRGHRLPYITLLPAIAFTATRLISTVALTVTPSIPLDAVVQFFSKWSLTLVFTAITAFLWDREIMIRTNTSTASGQRNIVHVLVHVALILLMFTFATAQAAAHVSLQLASEPSKQERSRHANIVASLNYTFYALVALSTVDVFVTAIRLSKAGRKAVTSDKVTNTVHYIISPFYALLNLTNLVFLIVISPRGLARKSPTGTIRYSQFLALEKANLAWEVIGDLLVVTIFGILLYLSIDCAHWYSGSTSETTTPSEQEEYKYEAPQVVQPSLPIPLRVHKPKPYGM